MAEKEYVVAWVADGIPEVRGNVVRCKDCKKQYCDLQDGRILCGRVDDGEIHPYDWFCADGERK